MAGPTPFSRYPVTPTAQAVRPGGAVWSLPARAGDCWCGTDHPGERDPLRPERLCFDTNHATADIQGVLDKVYDQMQTAQFASQGYALLFKPGTYYINCNVGFYTQVAGLGQNPDDVLINGGVNVNARWNNGKALENFWRTEENFAILPTASDTNTDIFPGITRIAVSQAAPIRRLHVQGELDLFDLWPSCHCGAGYASGGFLADSKVDGKLAAAAQQQWLSRNSTWARWGGAVWNMVFVGCQNAPGNTFPSLAYTVVAATPVIREKPYLYVGGSGNFAVFVPALETYSVGPSWANGPTPGTSVPISQFYIAQPSIDTAATLNATLAAGKNILFTPGTYLLNGTLRVNQANTILLGLGMPSLKAMTGLAAVSVADVDGVTIAGLIIDAGPVNSPVLLQVGSAGSSADHSANPTCLYDLTVRTGGPAAAQNDLGVEINSGNVVMDDTWIWRADHGNGVGWTTNPTKNGLIVNGNQVTCYGLFNEHHEQYQTVWNGNGGQVYLYQSEIPYDVPSQASWMNGNLAGYASYKVAEHVTSHEAWGVGIYCNFIDAAVTLNSAIEAPVTPNVSFHDLTTVWLNGVSGSQIAHLINYTGGSVTATQTIQILRDFVGRGSISNQPAAPSILNGAAHYGQVSLTWPAVATTASYHVKRATTSGTETTIATTVSNRYADTNIVNGTTYYYVVTAVAKGLESFNSAELTAAPPLPPMPAPPSGTVLLDFNGQGDAMPSPDASGFYWNNVATVASPVGGSVLPLNGSSQPEPLMNTTNGNSGWTLAINQLGPYGFNVNSAPDADGWRGPYPAAVASFPQRALAYGFTIGGPISVTLSGLNSGSAYNLLIYGGNTEWNQGIQTNTLTIGASPSLAMNTFNAQGNETRAVGWTNVTPSAGGQIAFTITPAAAGALNFMEVSPISTITSINTNPPAAQPF